ncbi:MAG: hypothetical protein ACOVOQ_15225 [Flavobacterium sp.]
MKKNFLLFIFLGFIILQSCKNNDYSSDEVSYENDTYDEVVNEDEESYSDNTYCADVEYYNPDTGFRNSYTLNVDVENNEVVKIHFSSGWLDDSEFSSEALDSNGSCSITCYDGRQFDIQITGSECSFTDESRIRNDDYDEKRKLTCPECGGRKYSYDDVCDDCKDKAEHTCKRCGEYDSFMWSSDDLCSDCKRDEDEKRRMEEEQE